MNCDDCQSRISEFLDAGQSGRHEPVVEGHLAECPACREFLDAWTALDARLTRHAAEAVLPADFKTALLARIPAPHFSLTPAEIAVRRAQFEHEYREAIRALDRRYFFPHPATMLRLMTIAGAIGFVGILLVEAMRTLPVAAEAALPRGAAMWTIPLLCGIIGLASVVYGLRCAGRSTTSLLPRWLTRRFGFAASFMRSA